MIFKTPWDMNLRHRMYKIASLLGNLNQYVNKAVSHTMFVYEIKGNIPKMNVEQIAALKTSFSCFRRGGHNYLVLKQPKEINIFSTDYDSALANLAKAFDDFCFDLKFLLGVNLTIGTWNIS